MIKEVTVNAATIDLAIEKAAAELGCDVADASIEILETPKRSLFGKNREAVIKATLLIEEEKIEPALGIKNVSLGETCSNDAKVTVAINYLQSIFSGMGIDGVTINVKEHADGAVLSLEGENLAVLIGHHGETLDALQYLVALTSNRSDGDYYRLTVDCGNYRDKREATLKSLAARVASKAKKTGRSQILEPMSPYERRIIHAVVSEIPGVYSKSKGEDPNRRVAILPEEGTVPQNFSRGKPRGGGVRPQSNSPRKPVASGGAGQSGQPVVFNKNTNRREDFAPKKPYVHKPERTMEDILKDDFKEKEKKGELYSKIDV